LQFLTFLALSQARAVSVARAADFAGTFAARSCMSSCGPGAGLSAAWRVMFLRSSYRCSMFV
jgi:hypothetical protein